MSVTQLVSKWSGWLKAEAPSNMFTIESTLLVLKGSGWLKALVPWVG